MEEAGQAQERCGRTCYGQQEVLRFPEPNDPPFSRVRVQGSTVQETVAERRALPEPKLPRFTG